jgi:hypothetical protein
MRPRSAQTGEGKIGCIFWLLALIVGAVIAWEVIPIKMKSVELHDFMEDQAAVATYSRDAEAMKKRILAKAAELDIPLDKDKLEVTRIGDRVRMKASYTIPAEFPGYTYYWKFEHEVDRNLYIF